MTSAFLSDRQCIARVRVRSACRDALQVSLRAEALLERLDLRPPGLPSAAILLIRTLRDPLPGSVSLARHGETAPARWKEAVATKIAQLSCEAARPASGPVPSGAGAVLFADEAELAACLVRDWLRGRVADRWWWRSVLGDLSPQQWLRLHVLARGEIMVPAIAVLAARSDAAAWLARLEDTEAEEAIAVIAGTHAVPLTVAQDESTAQRPRARNDRHGLAEIESGPRADSRSAALERLIAIVPEVLTPALRPPQRRLLALALALTRAPSWARTPQLAFALRGLDVAGLAADAHALATPQATQPEIPRLRDPRAATVTGAPPMGDTPPQRVGSPGATDGVGAAPPGPGESRALAQRRADVAYFGTRDAPHASTVARISALQNAPPTVTQTVEVEVPATQPETPTAAPIPRAAAPIPRAEPEEAPSFEDASRVRTQFGGIFYLLNAALVLKLYGDFTAPRTPGLALSPWDWLALVGRAWFGEEFVRDPVWKVLAEFAGRTPKDAPDRDFAAPPEWRIDPDWLAPWVERDALHVGVTRTRLRVLHAAGFVVFDVARDPAKRPLSQARALCATYDALRVLKLRRARALRLRAPARTATVRWLKWLLDYLRARLALALGADRSDDVPAILCRHPAEIAGTATGVHVHLALAGLPLVVRVAGLDRNPGWVPAAGRNIVFHFD